MDPAASRLLVLAPESQSIEMTPWRSAIESPSLHTSRLHEIQRLRGSVYARDGAITSAALTASGRHDQPEDYTAWHVASLDGDGNVSGCMRYIRYPNSVTFDDFAAVRHSELARSSEHQLSLRQSVNHLIARAQQSGIHICNPGGWAVADEHRMGTDAIHIVLGIVALSRVLGGTLGVVTATSRHRSASILKRMGARPLRFQDTELPPYYDPAYGCDMELLEVDSMLGDRFFRSHLAAPPEPVVVYPASTYAYRGDLVTTAR